MVPNSAGTQAAARDRGVPRIDFVAVAATDLPLIAEWLERPHVARWFHPAQDWLDEIRACLAANWKQQWMVSIGGYPAGYAQCYDCARAPVGMWSGCPAGTWGIDLFIGERQFLGRGLSTLVIRRLVDRCWQQPSIRWLVVDPEEDNAAACRVFEKAGFRPVPGGSGLWFLPRP